METPNKARTDAPTHCDHADFPLHRHPTGQWYKKIRGSQRYFGSIVRDPTGEAAWKRYEQERAFWESGQDPREMARRIGGERKVYVLWEIAESWLQHRYDRRRTASSAATSELKETYNLDSQKISRRTYDDSAYAVRALFKWANREQDVMGWSTAQWAKLHQNLGRGVSPATWSSRIMAIRQMIEWAVSDGMLSRLPHWGDSFPPINDGLKQRYRFEFQREHGDRVFDAATARRILEATDLKVSTAGLNSNSSSGFRGVSRRKDGQFEAYIVRRNAGTKTKIHLGEFSSPEAAAEAYREAAQVNDIDTQRQMIVNAHLFCACSYLAANTGAYSKDISSILFEDLDLDSAYLDRKRTKNGEYWQAVLWPETVERIKAYLAVRPDPDQQHVEFALEWKNLVFLSSTGLPINRDIEKLDSQGVYLHTNRKDLLKASMRKLLNDMGIKVKGVNFGAWRHSFESLASGALGLTREELQRHDALYRVGARKIPGSRNRYVKLPTDRLRPITDTVRQAIWPERGNKPIEMGRMESPASAEGSATITIRMADALKAGWMM